MKIRLAVLLLSLSACAFARDESAICAEHLKYPLPTGVSPQGDARRALLQCESQALLDAGELAKAASCAWIEREMGDEIVFGGSMTLGRMYANGEGVERNYALARRFVCEALGAPAEVEGRLAHLDAMERGEDRERFDFCDDVTSGYMMGFCAAREAKGSDATRYRERDAIMAAWPAAHRDAWKALQAAADTFIAARVANEVDASGTAGSMLMVGEEQSLRQELFEQLQAFERGEWPHGSAADLAAADRELNAEYAAARAAAKFEEPQALFGPLGTIRPDGIRDAERAWLKYRDAWVAFGAVRYPAVAPVAWQHFFTVQRVAQLRGLYAAAG